eukprot:m.204510 g.204510  ORF g.204510 m.204510 type:complete len:114 (+) comp39649_c0_seq10:184-525(+)
MSQGELDPAGTPTGTVAPPDVATVLKTLQEQLASLQQKVDAQATNSGNVQEETIPLGTPPTAAEVEALVLAGAGDAPALLKANDLAKPPPAKRPAASGVTKTWNVEWNGTKIF